ncbi:hypothetical protein DERF_009028 [Dermatophagoides farinae]|uniref:Uncharacterized protein n=1 Tax=Dermatophagoides farinae TaxID=6954 RepID=A0A922HX34_DERFA|nr:hypothetical protein DERF_009028 [Dermatophagoides farinae]
MLSIIMDSLNICERYDETEKFYPLVMITGQCQIELNSKISNSDVNMNFVLMFDVNSIIFCCIGNSRNII